MILQRTDPAQQLPVFTYGTLMSNQRAFGLLAKVVTHTVAARLDGARLHDVGPYPMLVLAGGDPVYGELHWLDPLQYDRTLRLLDAYEGKLYRREPVAVATAEEQRVTGWVFVGNEVVACRYPVVPSGRWHGGPPDYA